MTGTSATDRRPADDRSSGTGAGGSARFERKGLLLSVAGALAMAALGVGFFFVTDSTAVLLDGLFSLIGFATGLIGLRVATLVQRPDDESFHFGYAVFEPMLNLIKGLLVAFTTLFASISSIGVILDGGHEIRGAMAAVYAVLAATGCLAIAAVQRHVARVTGSPLLEVDWKNWLIDGVLSMAVAIAFLLVALLGNGLLAPLTPYADPVVVVVLSLLSAPIPFMIVRDNWRQLLGRAPAPAIRAEAARRIQRALEDHPGMTPHIRMLETGRAFYVQLYLILDRDAPDLGLADLDRLRERIHASVTEGPQDIGLDVIYTRDPIWIERTIGNRSP